jgi:hypothetical protein
MVNKLQKFVTPKRPLGSPMLLREPCAYTSRSMLAVYAVCKITYTVSKIQFPADGGNALDSYSRGTRFECRLGYSLS